MKKSNLSILKKITAVCLLALSILCTSCKKETKERVVIWTSCSEFAQYVELFNLTHPDCQAVLIYKENPSLSLPPAKDEVTPDIIVGSLLQNESSAKYFKPLDYLFDRKKIVPGIFYSQLLNAGQKKNKQYLLPVSFNLPAMIFANENKELVEENYSLTLENVRETAQKYTQKKRNGSFSRMGFTPLSSDDFLYLSVKLNGVNFQEENGAVVFDNNKLAHAIDYIKEWVNTDNGSIQEELDFTYKYLFMPNYRQVSSSRTLFAYTTSDQLFKIMQEQDLEIDYRWIKSDDLIPIEDSFTMMGIYQKSKNQANASEFITWFFDVQNQKTMLERKIKLNLNTEMFGIAGGFSAIQEVTEQVLPNYYPQMISNLPPANMLKTPDLLPPRWISYLNVVIQPYIRNSIIQTEENKKPDFADLEKEWLKKVFD